MLIPSSCRPDAQFRDGNDVSVASVDGVPVTTHSCPQHDFYNEQCSPETPLRCEIGDLSGRLGTIDLGQKRVVMSDPNLPLG